MPGIRINTGADFKITNLRIEVAEDGTVKVPSLTPQLRTDMWQPWLSDAVGAAVQAERYASAISATKNEGDDSEVTRLLERELIASMRAITGAAFAVDAFYASIKARSPIHPHEETWRLRHRTPRQVRVSETIRYHLKLQPSGARELKSRIKELYRFRGWAVHPGSKFHAPIFRSDVDAGIDCHYVAFSSNNATAAVSKTVQMLDQLIGVLDRGSEDLRRYKPSARSAMDKVLDEYERTPLPPFPRREPPTGSNEDAS